MKMVAKEGLGTLFVLWPLVQFGFFTDPLSAQSDHTEVRTVTQTEDSVINMTRARNIRLRTVHPATESTVIKNIQAQNCIL